MNIIQPVRLKKEFADGTAHEALDPWPDAMQVIAVPSHRAVTWFSGEKLTSMVYDAEDGIIQFTDLPYDEHVTIWAGKAILTSQDGQRYHFAAGDSFMMPKGWSGTWEFQEGYRELITFETKSIDLAMAMWFG